MIHKIRLAHGGDKENILSLLNSVFENQQRSAILRDDRYWNWKFIASPFGRSVLTVAEASGEIIGVDNLWPWEFILRENHYKAFQPCDSVVHSKFRGRGLFREMRMYGLQTIKGYDPAFMFNFPNSQSINVNLSLGWHNMGRVPWMVNPVKPFRIMRRLLDASQTRPVYPGEMYRLDIELLEALEEDALVYDNSIRHHRINGYFEWRYLNHPSRHYGMIHTQKGKSALAAIFTINQAGSYREMFIVELIGSPDLIKVLIREALLAAKSMNVSMVSLMQNNSFGTNKLWQAGFLQRKTKNMVVLPFNLSFEAELKSYNTWSMFACLHDSI